VTQGKSGKDLFSRFPAWFPDRGEERRRFFTEGVVVLDANVLLRLYRIPPNARSQTIEALQKVADENRLWLPHQACEEFIRGRMAAVESRNAMLRRTLADVRDHFQTAVTRVVQARRLVQQVIEDTQEDDEVHRHLERSITDRTVGDALVGWRDELIAQITGLQEAQDIQPDSLAEGDPLLDRINELLADRIGEPFSANDKKQLVDHFVEYRCPNKIPPGFEDAGKREPLKRAGDYLLWEQILRHAEADTSGSRLLLLVTDDRKSDWRSGGHPHPELAQELAERAGALLLLETTGGFLDGAREYLGVSVSEETYAEVERAAAEDAEGPSLAEAPEAEDTSEAGAPWPDAVDEKLAEDYDPGPLARDALKAAGFVTQIAKEIVAEDRPFAWWLIEATAAVTRRLPSAAEPEIHLPAIALADDVPQPDGWTRERLRVGEGIRNVWVAPWLARALRSLPAPDRNQLRRLAGERLTVDLRGKT
jgi:hypothetical protein